MPSDDTRRTGQPREDEELFAPPTTSRRIGDWLRRNALLLTAVLVVLLVGPLISRVLKSYRAIVLEVRQEQMLIAFNELPPRWVTAIDAEPGDIVQKDTGSFSPEVTEARADDRRLERLYGRYSREYEGTVTEIIKARSPGKPPFAVVTTELGERVVIPLASEKLIDLQEGERVIKQPNTWDPIVAGTADDSKAAPSPDGPTTSGSGSKDSPAQPFTDEQSRAAQGAKKGN